MLKRGRGWVQLNGVWKRVLWRRASPATPHHLACVRYCVLTNAILLRWPLFWVDVFDQGGGGGGGGIAFYNNREEEQNFSIFRSPLDQKEAIGVVLRSMHPIRRFSTYVDPYSGFYSRSATGCKTRPDPLEFESQSYALPSLGPQVHYLQCAHSFYNFAFSTSSMDVHVFRKNLAWPGGVCQSCHRAYTLVLRARPR